MAIHAIVANVELPAEEPSHHPVFKVAVAHLRELMEPVDLNLGLRSPEGVGVGEALGIFSQLAGVG
nr:hypothetical protein [Pontiella sulfatireligans]